MLFEFFPVVCCWGFCCWTGGCLCCLNSWFRWVLLDILGVWVACWVAIIVLVLFWVPCFCGWFVFLLQGGFCGWTRGGALGLIKLLPKRTNTQARQQEHHFERKNTEPNNTHLPFVGGGGSSSVSIFFRKKRWKNHHPSQTTPSGDVFFFGICTLRKTLLPQNRPYIILPPKTPTNPPRVLRVCVERRRPRPPQRRASAFVRKEWHWKVGKGPVFQPIPFSVANCLLVLGRVDAHLASGTLK